MKTLLTLLIATLLFSCEDIDNIVNREQAQVTPPQPTHHKPQVTRATPTPRTTSAPQATQTRKACPYPPSHSFSTGISHFDGVFSHVE